MHGILASWRQLLQAGPDAEVEEALEPATAGVAGPVGSEVGPPEASRHAHRMTETALGSTAPGPPPAEDMSWIPGGAFLMGSEDFYPEERPVRSVSVGGFWIDTTAVTAAQFRRFVRETDYVSVAERPLDPADYPDADCPRLSPHCSETDKVGRSRDTESSREHQPKEDVYG